MAPADSEVPGSNHMDLFLNFLRGKWNIDYIEVDEESVPGVIECTIIIKIDSTIQEVLYELGFLTSHLKHIYSHIHDAELSKLEMRCVFSFPKKHLPHLEERIFNLQFDQDFEEILSE